MKKSIVLFSLILLIGSVWCTDSFAQRDAKKTEYWVVKGYEARWDGGRQELGDAVISNILRTNCEPGDTGVTNQFNEYYRAYYAQGRGYSFLVRQIAFGPYRSWEEAEKQKRELLVSQSRSRYPNFLSIDRFSYLCD